MIKIEHIETWGFEHAIRGMRNPKNSWDRSDSGYGMPGSNHFTIGKKDLELMQKLSKAGSVHRKYLRQIFVSMDITAPHYFWHDFDTYKIGVTKDSCSKMHTLTDKEFSINDFSHDSLENLSGMDCNIARQDWNDRIRCLNYFRKRYLETGDKLYWRQLIEKLPESYNQKATVTMNYENVVTIIHQRSEHKLDEFREFCEELKKLPYIREIMEEN